MLLHWATVALQQVRKRSELRSACATARICTACSAWGSGTRITRMASTLMLPVPSQAQPGRDRKVAMACQAQMAKALATDARTLVAVAWRSWSMHPLAQTRLSGACSARAVQRCMALALSNVQTMPYDSAHAACVSGMRRCLPTCSLHAGSCSEFNTAWVEERWHKFLSLRMKPNAF